MTEAVSTLDPRTDTLLEEVNKQIRFHAGWRFWSMQLYVSTVVGMLGCTLGATLAGALGDGTLAAVLSGVATGLIGVEKTLLFREKWKLHLEIHTRLTTLRVRIQLGITDIKDATATLARILNEYARDLPMGSREGEGSTRD